MLHPSVDVGRGLDDDHSFDTSLAGDFRIGRIDLLEQPGRFDLSDGPDRGLDRTHNSAEDAADDSTEDAADDSTLDSAFNAAFDTCDTRDTRQTRDRVGMAGVRRGPSPGWAVQLALPILRHALRIARPCVEPDASPAVAVA